MHLNYLEFVYRRYFYAIDWRHQVLLHKSHNFTLNIFYVCVSKDRSTLFAVSMITSMFCFFFLYCSLTSRRKQCFNLFMIFNFIKQKYVYSYVTKIFNLKLVNNLWIDWMCFGAVCVCTCCCEFRWISRINGVNVCKRNETKRLERKQTNEI